MIHGGSMYMKNKEFLVPKHEIIRLAQNDIIATSDPIGGGGTTPGDNPGGGSSSNPVQQIIEEIIGK